MNEARKVIERVVNILCGEDDALESTDIQAMVDLLCEALTLLPEWQGFDPKREETWPKEEGNYLISHRGGFVINAVWDGPAYQWRAWNNVTAWMPLPPPYEK